MLAKRQGHWEIHHEERVSPPVKPKAKTDVRLRSQCFTLIIIAVVMGMTAAVQSAAVVKAGYALVQAKADVAKVVKETEILRLEIAKLKSPQRIETIAVQQLGMIMPQKTYYAAAATAATPAVSEAPASSIITRTVSPSTLADRLSSLLTMRETDAAPAR